MYSLGPIIGILTVACIHGRNRLDLRDLEVGIPNRWFAEFRTEISKLVINVDPVFRSATDFSLTAIKHRAFTLAREVLDAQYTCDSVRRELSYPIEAVAAAIEAVKMRRDAFDHLWEGVMEFDLPIIKDEVYRSARAMTFD